MSGADSSVKKNTSFLMLTKRIHARSLEGFTHHEAHAVLAWWAKWGHATQGGEYLRRVPFTYKDVWHTGISLSTFRRAVKKMKGRIFRKVIWGGGRSSNCFMPIEIADTNPIQADTATPSNLNRLGSQSEQGQGAHLNKIFRSKDLSSNSDPSGAEAARFSPEVTGTEDKQKMTTHTAARVQGSKSNNDTVDELVREILDWDAELSGRRQESEAGVLRNFIVKYSIAEVREAAMRQRDLSRVDEKCGTDLLLFIYRQFPSEEIPF